MTHIMTSSLDDLTTQAAIKFPHHVTLSELTDFFDYLSRQPDIEVEYTVATHVYAGCIEDPAEGGRRTSTTLENAAIRARMDVVVGEGTQSATRRCGFTVSVSEDASHYLGIQFRLDFGDNPRDYPAGEREVWNLMRNHVEAYQRFD